jgi:hypothetical protein
LPFILFQEIKFKIVYKSKPLFSGATCRRVISLMMRFCL